MLDKTVPGGCFLVGGIQIDGVFYGGQHLDANGVVLKEFADDEISEVVVGLAASAKVEEKVEEKAKEKPKEFVGPPRPQAK